MFELGPYKLKDDVFVIAEIGNNHEGSFDLAQRMICLAAAAGANAVKFQTYITELFISKKNLDRFNRLKQFELSFAEFEKLSEVANNEGIIFLSTPFDLESAAFLNTIVPAFKVASGDNTFLPLLKEIAGYGKPIILSTGLLEIAQIEETKLFIENQWKALDRASQLYLLHCVTSYPVNPGDAKLSAITTMQKAFGDIIGYSDHTIGLDAAVYATVLGAKIIEKHFTIDKHYSDFRDHQLSADASDMKLLVTRIRQAREILGTNMQILPANTQEMSGAVRRTIVAKHSINEGHVLQKNDLNFVRPLFGLPAENYNDVLGKKTRKLIQAGEAILLEFLD
jgi:sialic acid synthase SpsE